MVSFLANLDPDTCPAALPATPDCSEATVMPSGESLLFLNLQSLCMPGVRGTGVQHDAGEQVSPGWPAYIAIGPPPP